MTYPPDDKEFVPPEWMKLPNDVQLPSSLRMHNLIEKTALFISKHGSQMEIVVKAKQAKNPQFDFLLFDSPLNPYYKYLVTSMKTGDYVSSLEKPTDSGESDDEDHYLHPSLLGSTAKVNKSPEKLFLPQLPGAPDENSSYSQLVKSLKDKIVREPEKKVENGQSSFSGNTNNGGGNKKMNHQLPVSESSHSKNDSISILPSPPPEVQLYIDKLVEYVARKGEDFEKTIRKRNEARFEFLNPGNLYHSHYIKRKLHFLEGKRQAQAENIMSKTSSTVSNDSVKGSVSFSLTSKESKKTIIVNDDASPDQLDKRKDEIYNDGGQNSVSKKKQEERRRKATLFLSLLKKKQSENTGISELGDDNLTTNDTNNREHQITDSHSPNLSLSPSIEAVTSPASVSKNVNPSDESSSNSSKHRANSESIKPSSSLPLSKSSDRSKRDESSSPSSSTCSKHSSHHKSNRHHHHHHHPPHHHHHHHRHPHPPHHHHHRRPTPPHHHHHHHHGHHKHHRHHHHRLHHRRRHRSHSRSRSRSRSRTRTRSRSRSHSRSRSCSRSRSHSRFSSRSRSPSQSPRRKSRKRQSS